MRRHIIEDVTDEELVILDREGFEWYPNVENNDIFIEGDEDYFKMALHAIRRA